MSIPNFQSMMLPFLQLLADGKERFHKEIVAALADELKLTDEQKNACHEKSGTNILSNNVAWVENYLSKAGLITRPQRACFAITEAGKALVRENPTAISIRFLKDRYPVVAEWLKVRIKRKDDNVSDSASESEEDADTVAAKPPELLLEEVYTAIRNDLALELLDQVKAASWSFFERIVIDLLVKMGYGGSRSDAAKHLGKSGDGGLDGVINEDKLGLDVLYIQAKHYSDTVTISQVRDFAGALLAKKAKKGVFVTTSNFPKSAIEFVSQVEPKIILIDGQRLAELMIEYNIGVAIKDIYEIKRIDSDYFDENEY